MVRFRDVLKNSNFSKLWAGQIISNFGDVLTQMSLIALVSASTPGSAVGLAKFLFFVIIPVFIIGPVAGVYADRWDKRRVMIMSDILRGCLVLSIPALLHIFKSFIPVYVIVFLMFSTTRFFIPSKMAIIPELVPRHMLLVANTLSDTTRIIATFTAYAIAGFIVEYIGAIGGFYLNASTYFLSAVFISSMAVRNFKDEFREGLGQAREALKGAIRKSIWAELKDGLRYLTGSDKIRFVIRTWFFLMAGIGAISCVVIVFVQRVFGTATKHVSFLAVFLGAGLFVSMVSYGKLCQAIDKKRAIFLSIFAGGAIISVFGIIVPVYPYFWAAAALMAVLGISAGPIVTSLNTMVHESIPEGTRGRVFSSIETAIHLGFLAFMFAAAYLAERIDGFYILVASGGALSVYGLYNLICYRSS